MLEFPEEQGHGERWESYIVKPGWIRAKGSFGEGLSSYLLGAKNTIRLDILAKGMVDVALHGGTEHEFFTQDMNARGKSL